MKQTFGLFLLFIIVISQCYAYSAKEDARIIAAFKQQLNHAKVARSLVHQTNWASVGTISTNSKIIGYPMVNIISIDDNDIDGTSTGKVHFLLTDLDFTGPDWKHNNKVTFLFTSEQNSNCSKNGMDPMEPTCPRAMISGKVAEMDKNSSEYVNAIIAFQRRHPAAKNWMKAHSFYMCELNIENIFVLDYYGGPHDVPVDLYFNTEPDIVDEK